MTAARASRGYLLTWLGAVLGALPALLLPMAVIRGSGCADGNGCGLAGGFFVAGIAVTVGFYATLFGIPTGTYAALRLAGREAAGLTTWLFLLVCGCLVAVHSALVRVLGDSPLMSWWQVLLSAATLTSPVIARHLALRAADSLRKYR
jgi:hypothetical protein